MSSGPETRFIASVHRHLPPVTEFHREKMANPYRGGTADSWYSGDKGDLWIEWKWIELPKRDTTEIDLTAGAKPMLSMLQQDWIKNRLAEGRRVWVVVGFKEGCMIFKDTNWSIPYTAKQYRLRSWSREETADQILQACQRDR